MVIMGRMTLIVVALLAVLAVAAIYIIVNGENFARVHDVAISSVTASAAFVYLGDTVTINVTARNKGNAPETFNVTSYWNTTEVAMQTVFDLPPNAVTDLMFQWSTAKVASADYSIWAEASLVRGEANATDNTYTYGIVEARNSPIWRARVFVDPQTSVAAVDQNFTIGLNIINAVDLHGWEFRLRWNATVLEAVNIIQGEFVERTGATFPTLELNNTAGTAAAACVLQGLLPGVSGNGTLVTMQFHVKESGHCDIGFYYTKLVSSLEQEIAHTVRDGSFST